MNEKDFIPQTQEKLYKKGMTSDYLDRLSIVDRRTKKPLTKEEFVKFSEMRDAILKEDLTRLYEDGVPVVGERKLKPYDKATVTEIDKALDWLKSKATRETKEKLFGATITDKVNEEFSFNIEELDPRNPKDGLLKIAKQFLTLLRKEETLGTHRIMFSSALIHPELCLEFYQRGPLEIHQQVRLYNSFDRKIEYSDNL